MLWLCGIGLAADVWVGGGVSGGVTFDPAGLSYPPAQAEIDLRVATDLLYLQVDADVHFDLNVPGVAAYPLPPEWASLQIGRETYHLKVGVNNPAIGVQAWDEWDNYLPTVSQSWAFQPAQIVGLEPGMTFEDGGEVFVWGGYDLAWFAPNVGAGYASEQDAWSTWSGVYAYPTLDCGTATPGTYVGAVGAFEVYPSDALWLTVDGTGGLACGTQFVSGQLIVNVVPEAIVAPAARIEATYDPDAFGTGNNWAVSVGARSFPVDWLWVAVEGKAMFVGDTMTPSVTLMVGARRPEPEGGSAVYEEEEE